MEGGIRLKQALEWVNGKDLREVLELSLSLEVNSIDLYIKMERKVENPGAQQVFFTLSNQERKHLERLNRLFEKI